MLANNASAQRPPTVLSGASDVAPVVDAYRKLLGDPNNGTTTGSQASGRREINWDGVPDDKAAPAFLPGDFFKGRGAKLATPGKGVQVSAAPVPVMNEGFSFLGVVFEAPIVARVRIEYGSVALGADDDPKNGKDVSVMDDFIFGEPQPMGSPPPTY